MSEGTRRKIGNIHRGKKLSEDHIKKIVVARMAHPPTEKEIERRKRLGEWNKTHGRLLKRGGWKLSKETRGNISLGLRGRKLSEEHKNKLSSVFKGRPRPDIKGEKAPGWKGGISFLRDYRKRLNSLRRARKCNAHGSYSIEEWENLKIQYDMTCPCCNKKEPEIRLSADHIVPLSRGGDNNIENIQPLCRSCNSKKHVKVIKYEIKSLSKIA